MSKFSNKSIGITIASAAAAVLVGGAIVGAVNSGNSSTQTEQSEPTTTYVQPAESLVTTKTVTETEAIPFSSSQQEDANLAKGQTQVKVSGVEGEKTITYEVKYQGGQEISRSKTGETVTREPVNEVVLVGAYVAPPAQPNCANGTYVNSVGNTVCRPSTTNTGGATAVCRDGTYSYSQSRRGTCSSHGGVAQWL
jgi:hypothetical protein